VIPAQTQLLRIEGAGHDLARGRFDMNAVIKAVLAK
jgi:hypothetical protein